MHRFRHHRPSPALVVALCALFFALGGSAFALGTGRTSAEKASPYQLKCAQGAVRGIAFVKGDPNQGIANLPETYTNAAAVFGYKFNCSGGDIQVRRSGNGMFDVKFVGNPAIFAVGSVVGPNAGAVSTTRAPDGAIRVTVSGPTAIDNFAPRGDQPFIVVLL